MKIYLAARFDRRKEIARYRKRLEALGHEVVSTWLDSTKESDSDLIYQECGKIARRELSEIKSCEVLALFTQGPEDGYTSGGHNVEFGYAVGLNKGIVIVGPAENIFCCIAVEKHTDFESWYLTMRTE